MHGREEYGNEKVNGEFPLKIRLSFAFQNADSMSQILPYGSLINFILFIAVRAGEGVYNENG